MMPAFACYLGSHLCGALRINIGDDNGGGSVLGEGEAEGTAYSAGAARDDRYPVLDLHAQRTPGRPRAASAHAARSGSAAIRSAYFFLASSRFAGMYSVGHRPGWG